MEGNEKFEIWDDINGIWLKDKKYENFFNEIENVCKKYNLSISHQDHHGSFEIEKFDEYNIKWLKEANLRIKEV